MKRKIFGFVYSIDIFAEILSVLFYFGISVNNIMIVKLYIGSNMYNINLFCSIIMI